MGSFRELAPIELWSAKINLAVPQDYFTPLLAEVAHDQQFTFFGFFIINALTAEPTAYHFTRYPREKYGVRSLEDCQNALETLKNKMAQKNLPVSTEIETRKSIAPYTTRVVMGLVEGYGAEQSQHDPDLISLILDKTRDIAPAQIHTVGPERFYTEPAIRILAGAGSLKDIYVLALATRQERFTVERFRTKKSRVVETKHAKQPD